MSRSDFIEQPSYHQARLQKRIRSILFVVNPQRDDSATVVITILTISRDIALARLYVAHAIAWSKSRNQVISRNKFSPSGKSYACHRTSSLIREWLKTQSTVAAF